MKKTFFLPLLLLFFLCGCYKINKVSLMKGEWEITEFLVNGGSLNQLGQLLPDYKNNGRYVIYMLDDGVMKSEYYVGNTLNYEEWGEWELESSDYLYINIDKYVNGIFKIHSNGDNKYTLYSESNIISFYNIGLSTTVLEFERH